MLARATSDESLVSYSPLLGDPVNSNQSFCSQRLSNLKKKHLILGTISLTLLIIISAVLGYFIENGAFSHVSRDVRIVNGTVVEPNTKIAFPVNRPSTMDGTPRVQRLIGLFLKTKHVPQLDASLRLFVLAVYVDRLDGRRELVQYKNGAPHAHQETSQFEQFLKTISSGRVTVTAEYRMVMSPPGTQMHDHWLSDLVDLWKSYGATPERISTLKQCFSNWFLHHGFHNHDDIFIEYNSKSKATRATINGDDSLKPCADPFFGRAFVSHEFLENGNLAADLLPTLWNTEYDNSF